MNRLHARRNVFVSFENGENVLVYCDERLSNEQIRKLAEKNVGEVSDIYDIKDDEIQYYCIDGRCWYNTDEMVRRVKECIKEN